MSKIKPKMEVTFKVVYYFVFNVFFWLNLQITLSIRPSVVRAQSITDLEPAKLKYTGISVRKEYAKIGVRLWLLRRK